MSLPLLVSVPHAGLTVPPEAQPFCRLTADEIAADGDGGAAEAYAFPEAVRHYVTTPVARAIVDMNRAPDDRRPDGVVKTHTCWDVPVYEPALPESVAQDLLARYHTPFHAALEAATDVVLAVDCHTMAAVAPPVAPDPGAPRPGVCLSHAPDRPEGPTCPEKWFEGLAEELEKALGTEVARNRPFKGGYITRRHGATRPVVQLELSRGDYLSWAEKRRGVLAALTAWCDRFAPGA